MESFELLPEPTEILNRRERSRRNKLKQISAWLLIAVVIVSAFSFMDYSFSLIG
jgi:hypothetical protein